MCLYFTSHLLRTKDDHTFKNKIWLKVHIGQNISNQVKIRLKVGQNGSNQVKIWLKLHIGQNRISLS